MKSEITIFIFNGKWTVKIIFENGTIITSQFPKEKAIEIYKKLKTKNNGTT